MKAKKVSWTGWLGKGVEPQLTKQYGYWSTNIRTNKPLKRTMNPKFWPPRKVVVTVREVE